MELKLPDMTPEKWAEIIGKDTPYTGANAPYIQPENPLKEEEKKFYIVPDSPVTNLVTEVLLAGPELNNLPARKKQINHGSMLEVLTDGNRRRVISSSPTAKIMLEITDIEKFTGNNKPAKKMFVLSLIKANEQAIFNGELGRDYVSFPLQELVDIGFYTSIRAARRGFTDAMDILTDIKLSGDIQISKKKKITFIGPHPFRKAAILNNQCFIQLESDFNWSSIVQYFTTLPRYYFKLSNKGADLLYYIFYLARTNTRDIEERGYFTIKFRTIQNRLQLPSEKGLNNPKRDIIERIEEAIGEIEAEHLKQGSNTEFVLTPVFDNNGTITDYLDNGYLKISLNGSYAKAFIEISEDTAKQIEASHKRQARITEAAVAIKAARSMETEDKKTV